uniref:Uncharacterized protein n=1 Tax=Arundo donax TaxID=35708 RepID=A0A0A9FMZ6_ARUDO
MLAGMAPWRPLLLRLSSVRCGNAVKSKVSSWPLMPAPGRRSPTMWLVALLHNMPNHEQIELACDQEDKLPVLPLSNVNFHWRSATSSCWLPVAWTVHMTRKMWMQKRFLCSSIISPMGVYGNKKSPNAIYST